MQRIHVVWLVLLFAAHATLADRVVLENGNVLEGRAERRGNEVVVRSALGTLVLSADSVRRIEWQDSEEADFLEQLKRAETVEELLALAVRCRAAGPPGPPSPATVVPPTATVAPCAPATAPDRFIAIVAVFASAPSRRSWIVAFRPGAARSRA